MNLSTEVFGDCVVVHAPQDLGREQAPRFESFLNSLDKVKVVLDLDDCEQFDGPGLESILNAQESMRTMNGDVKISVTSNVNRKILEITRLDRQLDVFDSVIEAVKSFR